MTLTIPYHPAYAEHYPEFADAVISRGVFTSHSVNVIAMESQSSATDFLTQMLKRFQRGYMTWVPEIPEPPAAVANRLFQTAVMSAKDPRYIHASESIVLYMDPTWRPLKNRWMDLVLQAWNIRNRPMAMFSRDPKLVQSGPVLLHPEFEQRSVLFKFLSHDQHWRNYLAGEFRANGITSGTFGKSRRCAVAPKGFPISKI